MAAAVDVFRWAAGLWLLWRVRPVPPGEAELADVSVVVPARNEAGSIPGLLASLEAAGRAGAEVIVVDDASDDGTGEVAAAGGARVVTAPALPEGWTGKTWACATGAAASGRPLLVFADADVTFAPGGLARVVATLSDLGGLVSVEPYHELRRPTERLSLFFNIVSMMGVGAFTPLGAGGPTRGAFGPVLACRRADYDAAGGHAGVRQAIVEDMALADRFRLAERPVTLFGGRGVASFRMYPDGLRSLVEGWTKNMAGGARATSILTLVLTVGWLSGCIQAATGAVARPAVFAAYALQVWWHGRRLGRYGPIAALVYPVELAFFLVVFAWSVLRTFVWRSVRWKGRAVALRR